MMGIFWDEDVQHAMGRDANATGIQLHPTDEPVKDQTWRRPLCQCDHTDLQHGRNFPSPCRECKCDGWIGTGKWRSS